MASPPRPAKGTLSQAVHRRFSEQLLIELTNQDETGDRAVVEDRVEAAVQDAQGEFLTMAGVCFDESDAEHVAAGVLGVGYYLHLYSGKQTDAMARWRELWEDRLQAMSQRLGERRRLEPVTSSPLDQSTQRQDTRPDFDRRRAEVVVPRLPDSGDDSEV